MGGQLSKTAPSSQMSNQETSERGMLMMIMETRIWEKETLVLMEMTMVKRIWNLEMVIVRKPTKVKPNYVAIQLAARHQG